MAKQFTILVIIRTQDNGDGGYTTYAYNNEDDMLKDHPKAQRWDSKQKKEVPVELSEDDRNAILTEDDPYENGYIGDDEIVIETDDDGSNPRLAKPISFHVGQ